MNHATTLDGKNLDVVGEHFALKFARDMAGERVVHLYLHAAPGMWFYRATFDPFVMADLISVTMEALDKAAAPQPPEGWAPVPPPPPARPALADPEFYGF